MFKTLLESYGFFSDPFQISNYGSGLINSTWKVTDRSGNYILQLVNKQVFKEPENIAHNYEVLEEHLKDTAPDYLFLSPIRARNGRSLIHTKEGDYFRLFRFIEDSHTVDFLSKPNQAYEAAKQFGRFTRLLDGLDTRLLRHTLDDFHNLTLRYEQYEQALAGASSERLEVARGAIKEINRHRHILETYSELIKDEDVKIRTIHHDTKISNVLFDKDDLGICVIDLDTVMPGLYISDVGDMLRTYLSPTSEEDTDFDKIVIREEFFRAIYLGYMEEMGGILTEVERSHFIFAGEFMVYMQALRFLADFLNGDIYYQVKYPGHNLMRAGNQLAYLNRYIEKEPALRKIIIAPALSL